LSGTSLKMQENMVITGGKESRTYGIVLQTGQINYECSMNECTNFQEHSSRDMLVVQRNTQTVRAHVPRTGEQKWNFSVSLHDVAYHPAEDPCDQDDSDEEQNEIVSEKTTTSGGGGGGGGDDFTLKAIVPDGLICATDEQDLVKWRRKFPSPIVDVWRLRQGRLERVDLFSKQHIPPRRPPSSLLDDDDDDDVDDEVESPFLYIGSHQSQLYIQESVRMRAEADAAFMTVDSPELSSGDGSSLVAYPRVTWRPYLVRSVLNFCVLLSRSFLQTFCTLPQYFCLVLNKKFCKIQK
jgi:eukaryotic translation initiation factor 2-alpha kinase 3